MATVRKKISELTALNSASLDTTIVGVDNGVTYKIELDTLADAVTARVNILDRDRLNSLESVTSSFESKGRNIVSSSAQITTFGFISESVNISSLNLFTQSFNNAISVIGQGQNSITTIKGHLFIEGTSSIINSTHIHLNDNIIELNGVGEYFAGFLVKDPTGISTVSGSLKWNSNLDRWEAGKDQGDITSISKILLADGDGVITSSAQITALGFVSESVNISSLNSFTASQNILNTAFTNGINARLQTSSFNDFSASVDSRIIAATNEQLNLKTGSYATTGSNVFKGQQIISGAFTVSISGNAFGVNENPTPNNIFWSYIPNDTNTTSIESGWVVNVETVGIYTVTNVEYDYPFVKITLSDALLQLPYRCNGYFSLPSSELKFGTDGVLKISGSLSVSGSITGSTNFNTIVNKPTLISGSSQLTSSLDTRYAASGSAPTLFLLEAYANETYTLPGGFTDDTCRYSIVNNTVNVPSNWFNTSTYRFTPQKAGYWQIIASYDIYRNSEASIAIRKNGGVVAAAGTFNSVAQQVTKIVYLNGSTDYIDVMNTGGASLSRSQYDSRSWFQAKWIGQ